MTHRRVKRTKIVSEYLKHDRGGAVLCERLPINGAQFADNPPAAFLVMGADFDSASPPPLDALGAHLAQAHDGIASTLSRACESFNQDIAEFCRTNGAEWIEDASGAVVVVSGSELVLAICGPIAAFIIETAGVTEITESIPTAERQPTALRFFASLIEGELPEGSRLAVVSASLFNHIDKDALIKLFSQRDLQKIIRQIQATVEGANESVFGLFIESKSADDQEFESFNEAPTLLERPQRSALPSGRSITNAVAVQWKKLSPIHRTTALLAVLAGGLFLTSFTGLEFAKNAKLAQTETPAPAEEPEPIVAGEAEQAPQPEITPPLVAFDADIEGMLVPMKDAFGLVDLRRDSFTIYDYNGKQRATPELSVDVVYATESDDGIFVIDAEHKLYHWSAATGSLAKIGTLDAAENMARFYNGRIYAIATGVPKFTIARYEVDKDTKKLGARSVWANADTSALDMIIDGSIYVSAKEETLTFFKGTRTDPRFAESGLLWTVEEAEELYILYKQTVDVFEKKTGKKLRSITIPFESEVLDFFIHLKQKQIFLLSPDGIRVVPLE